MVGTALSGEQAIEVIREKKPDVVLTDIRMKQMTGLQMMDTIQQTGQECLFVVLSAYRDFEYAKEACDLGAFAYLLKPIEDDKLQETMQNAYRSCMEKQKKEERMESWENLVMKDATSFLQVIVQKYLFNQISFDKLTEVFETVDQPLQKEERFIAVNTDIDLALSGTKAAGEVCLFMPAGTGRDAALSGPHERKCHSTCSEASFGGSKGRTEESYHCFHIQAL